MLDKVWADGGYANRVDTSLVDYARAELGPQLEIVRRCDDVKGIQVMPAGEWSNALLAG